MENIDETPDILNSKIKKIRIELPHYTLSHSSSGDSPHEFIGRERIRERIKKVIEDSPNEPGVYLIAGNRGVGKTSLLSWVINETSLKNKSKFTENFKYFILFFILVAGAQFCLQIFEIPKNNSIDLGNISLVIFFIFFFLLSYFNSYRYENTKQNMFLNIFFGMICAIKELSYLLNTYNPYRKTQYFLKIMVIISFTQFVSIKTKQIISPTAVFSFYIIIILAYNFIFRFLKSKFHINKQEYKDKTLIEKIIFFILHFIGLFIKPIWYYIKNHNRLYLRINFGHKLRDEKDILRLITSTLSREYIKYHRSFRRMLPRRVITFGLLFLFALFFSPVIGRQEFYKKLVKEKDLYKVSSQVLLNDTIYLEDYNINLFKENNSIYYLQEKGIPRILLNIKNKIDADIINTIYKEKDVERLNNIFNIAEKQEDNKVENMEESDNKIIKHTWIKSKINTKVEKIGNFFLILDQLVFEITKVVKKTLQFFFCKYEKEVLENKYVPPINYLFWLSFLIMYLLFKLLFCCNWIMNMFVTHQIINRKLKKLNSDIVHSTERENTIKVNSGNTGPEIGTNTKKTRNVADAREIEKELQDILEDMQRIPIILCRPNVVIVFDELDKVEPGDSNIEKDNTQTKASLFSIYATRERQTEILKILSNMKYFLSTARAKFVFIAGREMFDIHLADVSERNNYIGSIFNVVILVPSFLTDHHSGEIYLPQESSIASLPEEFVCRRLFPHDYHVDTYNLQSYRNYLEKEIFNEKIKNNKQKEIIRQEKIDKIIAVLQQFIIYLAHVSKGAPKKMIQLFESHIDIHNKRDNQKNTLLVRRYHSSRYFLSFNYYKQYTLGIIAYLITPIFYRLAESNIKEHSDKLLISSLRFVDFLFKFHKHSFSWKHLDMSPEMLEVNRAPELKSVTVDLLNYLTQVHINKSNFSLSDYKFDGLIANEIFAMAKTDEVFSALFSFSLDEMLPLKKNYQDLLEKKENEYEKSERTSEYIDAISSLQEVLGDLYYYDDELEEAETYYKSAIQVLSKMRQKNKDKSENEDNRMTLEQLYVYVRNMLSLGIIYEKRNQYDLAYLTYGELCERIIKERDIDFYRFNIGVELRKDKNDKDVFVKASTTEWLSKEDRMYYENIEVISNNNVDSIKPSLAMPQPLYFNTISPKTNDMLFKKITFEGLKMLYLPFIAKLQILEQSHIGGITLNHLIQLDKEFKFLTFIINHEEAKILEAEFYSRVADILYYKNLDLKDFNCNNDKKYSSCTACDYYLKSLSVLLKRTELINHDQDIIRILLSESVEQLNDNYNMKFCTTLARILSDWGNVFFSCDTKNEENGCGCYICGGKIYNTRKKCYDCACYICDIDNCETNNLGVILKKYIEYLEYELKDGNNVLLKRFSTGNIFSKMEIAFSMYTISSKAYRKANIYKRSAYQIYKMLYLFKHYEISNEDYIKQLSEKAIHYLWYANDDLNVLELTKRKKDFNKNIEEIIPLKNLLVDSEITRIRILVKELELSSNKLKEYYDLRITSPYRINYSIVGRIYRLRLKTKVNYKAYQHLLKESGIKVNEKDEKKFTLENEYYKKLINNNNINTTKEIFGKYFNFDREVDDEKKVIIDILENLIADSIYCLTDIAQLSETMEETYLFPHSFLGSIHEHLSFWIRQYKEYNKYKGKNSRIDELLDQYLGEEWKEQLSGYRENQRALSHYYKCLEMHNEGRAYHNMIDNMYYLKDDFNDRSDHFNIAEERHLIVNGKIDKSINQIKDIYKDSKLYDVDNYFNND